MFLTFCSRLDIEPNDLLRADSAERLDPEAMRSAVTSLVRAAPRKQNRHPELTGVLDKLSRALETELALAPAFEHVANGVGVPSQVLRYHYPEHAKAISRRWRSAMRGC